MAAQVRQHGPAETSSAVNLRRDLRICCGGSKFQILSIQDNIHTYLVKIGRPVVLLRPCIYSYALSTRSNLGVLPHRSPSSSLFTCSSPTPPYCSLLRHVHSSFQSTFFCLLLDVPPTGYRKSTCSTKDRNYRCCRWFSELCLVSSDVGHLVVL